MKIKLPFHSFLLSIIAFNAHSSEPIPISNVGKPNFVLILADDLGYADISLNGSRQIQTPNIDHLAFEGINLTQGYVSAPVCSPSRAGLLTGKNQVTFGYDNNLDVNQPGFDPEFMGLPLTELTIAERLKPLGYVSGLIGKWHLGSKKQYHPLNRGFDEFWGFLGGAHEYYPTDPGKTGAVECNYKVVSPISYITDDMGDECVDFIKRHKDNPFFLFASFNAPHLPLQAIEEDLELYDHIRDMERRTYCAMVHRLDINVGKIMKALEEEGIAENTLVVFFSDNGGPCDQNTAINAPLRGQKGILLEGGLRVPFILRWKSVLPGGKTYTNPVISFDLTPTFLELAGGTIENNEGIEGVNIIPYLLSQNKSKPHESLYWRFTISAALLQDHWKLVRLPDRLPMLYNLKEDISEMKDLAMEHPDITKAMLKELGEWDVQLPHPIFLEGAIWKKRQLDLYDKEYLLIQP